MITIICRDFYREHPPIKYVLNVDSKELACERVMKKEWIKEILDVGKELIWNREKVTEYWRLYSDKIDESKITREYLEYIPIR